MFQTNTELSDQDTPNTSLKKTVRFSIETEVITNNYVDDEIPDGKYCKSINLVLINMTHNFDNWFWSTELMDCSLVSGGRYMVVDCGGGTVDITVHEIINNEGHLKELFKATGGPYGSVSEFSR